MQNIQVSNRNLQLLKVEAEIIKTTTERLLAMLIKEQIAQTVPVVVQE
jgi:hypothetical protein